MRNTHLVQEVEDLLLTLVLGLFHGTGEGLALRHLGLLHLLLLGGLHLLLLLTLTFLLLEVLVLLDGDGGLHITHTTRSHEIGHKGRLRAHINLTTFTDSSGKAHVGVNGENAGLAGTAAAPSSQVHVKNPTQKQERIS